MHASVKIHVGESIGSCEQRVDLPRTPAMWTWRLQAFANEVLGESYDGSCIPGACRDPLCIRSICSGSLLTLPGDLMLISKARWGHGIFSRRYV